MSQLKVDSVVPRAGLPSGAQGRIIQIKYTPVRSIVSISTTEAGSNMSAFDTQITPTSANSRFIIQLYCNVSSNGGNSIGIMIRRNNSEIDAMRADDDGGRRRYTGRGATTWNGDGNHLHNYLINVMDTPSTTNSITYKAFFAIEGSHTMYLNRHRTGHGDNANDRQTVHASRAMSSMTVYEVEGQ